jgi:hypothetical protein
MNFVRSLEMAIGVGGVVIRGKQASRWEGLDQPLGGKYRSQGRTR